MPTDERLLDPDCRDGKCGSCVGGPCEHECHSTAPDLRDAVAVAITSHEWDDFPRSAHGDHNYYGECAICQGDVPRIAEVALAALMEDPGDLPKRMAEALALHDYGPEIVNADDAIGERYRARAAAVMGVRDELVAHLAARAAKAEARVEHAEAGAQLSSERLAKARQELAEAEARADKAEYDLEIRTHTARSNARAHRVAYLESEKQRERAEKAEAELAVVKRNWQALSESLANARKEIAGRKEHAEKLQAELNVETTTTPARETA